MIGDRAFGYYYDDNWNLTKIENFTIYGVKGSAAETYAVENGFKFIETGNTSTEITGDVNGDGETTSTDALYVLQVVVGMK